jgi:hydroxyethylthiazole kinase-like uncharacterized protein yjeF
MIRITPGQPWPLLDSAASRQLEANALAGHPPHTLMRRAGFAVARLALAYAPHAQTVWVACGPGNNGGDGLEAAMHLRQWGKTVVVTWLGQPERRLDAATPYHAETPYQRARAAGVQMADEPPAHWDLALDALLGLGGSRAPEGAMAQWIARMNTGPAPVLAVDLPTGLSADSGQAHGACVQARASLCLLSLKPGLFTAQGRDAAGDIWFDDLGCAKHLAALPPTARLLGAPAARPYRHDSHKGSHGDVAVVGGADSMVGAALLAGSAALHGGAGRVFIAALAQAAPAWDAAQPELMFRPFEALDLQSATVVCGCGGGDAVRAVLPTVLSTAPRLVLDADALNAIAQDAQLARQLRARDGKGWHTVLTPHPLEAARLLDSTAKAVQHDRLAAAQRLAEQCQATVVLKGSGSVVAAPGQVLAINPTGNGRLATAGSGDVLAGLVSARLAGGDTAWDAACHAVYQHGLCADQWPPEQALTAAALARALSR